MKPTHTYSREMCILQRFVVGSYLKSIILQKSSVTVAFVFSFENLAVESLPEILSTSTWNLKLCYNQAKIRLP